MPEVARALLLTTGSSGKHSDRSQPSQSVFGVLVLIGELGGDTCATPPPIKSPASDVMHLIF